MRATKRVFAYVDGWNFQVSTSKLRRENLMWINLPKLCSRFIDHEHESLAKVYLFTALNPKLESKIQICWGQLDFQRSLGVEVREGYFGKIKFRSKNHEKTITYKEKESDVSLAIQLVEDSILGLCEKSILISNDGDFAPAIKKASKYGVNVEVLAPSAVSVNRKLSESIGQKVTRQISEKDLELSNISKG